MFSSLLTRSRALPRAHPDYLRALARWFDVDAPPAETARVLDVGCGYGTHALMLAAFNPEMRIIAIDQDPQAIEVAKQAAAQLGVTNVRFICQDIAKIKPKPATVDYLICHDVFSYLDDARRTALFHLAASALSEHGVAYIAYSTYPGWKLLESYADMMRYRLAHWQRQHRDASLNHPTHYAQDFLRLIHGHIHDEHPLKPALTQYAAEILELEPSKLALDFIAHANRPLYFHQFMAQAEQAELAFIGEAQFRQVLMPAIDERTAAMLAQECGEDLLAKQQYQDFLSYQNHRQTLLTHQRHAPFHNVTIGLKNDTLLSMHIQGGFQPPSEHTPAWQSLQQPAVNIRDSEISRLVCGRLNQAGLSSVLVSDIVAEAAPDQRADVRQLVLLLIANQTVMVRASAVQIHTVRIASKPKLHPLLAKMVALRAAHPDCFGLSNRWHQELALSPAHETVMQRLDGEHERAALIDALCEAWQGGELALPDGLNAQDHNALSEHAETVVKQTLKLLSAQGLLEDTTA